MLFCFIFRRRPQLRSSAPSPNHQLLDKQPICYSLPISPKASQSLNDSDRAPCSSWITCWQADTTSFSPESLHTKDKATPVQASPIHAAQPTNIIPGREIPWFLLEGSRSSSQQQNALLCPEMEHNPLALCHVPTRLPSSQLSALSTPTVSPLCCKAMRNSLPEDIVQMGY